MLNGLKIFLPSSLTMNLCPQVVLIILSSITPNINKINERYGSVSAFEGEDFQSTINRFLSQKTGTMRLLESGKMFR